MFGEKPAIAEMQRVNACMKPQGVDVREKRIEKVVAKPCPWLS
jgi:hypothetical protein